MASRLRWVGVAVYLILLTAGFVYGATSSTKWTSTSIPEVGDEGTTWGTNLRAYLLSVDEWADNIADIATTTCANGEGWFYSDTSGQMECDTPAGTGDMVQATWDSEFDTDDDGNIDLAAGGTNATLTDPNADRLYGWDDSAGSTAWITAGTGISWNGTTNTLSASGGGTTYWTRSNSAVWPTNAGDTLGTANTIVGVAYFGTASFTGGTVKLNLVDSTASDDDYDIYLENNTLSIRNMSDGGGTVLREWRFASGGSFRVDDGWIEISQGLTGPGFIYFFEDESFGTNKIKLTAPSSNLSSDYTLNLPSSSGTLATTGQVFGGNFSDLAGSITDAQVPDDITINSSALSGDVTSAQIAADMARDSELFGGNFSDLAGSATDAQVPDDITITAEADSFNATGVTADWVLASDGSNGTKWKADAGTAGLTALDDIQDPDANAVINLTQYTLTLQTPNGNYVFGTDGGLTVHHISSWADTHVGIFANASGAVTSTWVAANYSGQMPVWCDTTANTCYYMLDDNSTIREFAYGGGAFHDGFSDFVAAEHINWTTDQGATNIHSSNVPLAATATALAADGGDCAAGEIPLGVDASGAAEGCYEPAFTDVTGTLSGAQLPAEVLTDSDVGTTVQAWDAQLDDVADGSFATNFVNTTYPWAVNEGGSGSNTFTDGGPLLGSGSSAFTALGVMGDGEVMIGDGVGDPVYESGATLRTSLGLAIGTDVQAYSSSLAAISDGVQLSDVTVIAGDNITISGNTISASGAAVAGSFAGAMVAMAATETVPDGTPQAAVWDTAVYDTDGFDDIGGSNPERLTVTGAAVSKVVLSAQLYFATSATTSDNSLSIQIRKNGSSFSGGGWWEETDIDFSAAERVFAVNLKTPPVAVSQNDYFDVYVSFTDNIGSTALLQIKGSADGNYSWFGIEVVDPSSGGSGNSLTVTESVADTTVTTALCANHQWYGNTSDPLTFTLPDAAAGLQCAFTKGSYGGSITIRPQTADIVMFGPTILDAGDMMASGTTNAVVELRALDAVYWTALPFTGTWEDAGSGIDAASLTITAPTTAATYSTETSPITVGGDASSGYTVQHVTWANSEAATSGTATGTTSWSASIALVAGTNTIRATMEDAQARTAGDTIAVAYTTGGGGTSFIDQETFETTGMPADWSTAARDLDWDNTSSPPEGSEWLFADDDNGGNRQGIWDFTGDASEVYVAFYIKIPATNGSPIPIALKDSTDDSKVYVLIDSSGNIRCDGDITATSWIGPLADDTLHRIQVRAKAGAGADGECEIWATDGTSSWGTPQSSTDGTWTVNIDKVGVFLNDTQNTDFYLDNIIVDDAMIDITEYP